MTIKLDNEALRRSKVPAKTRINNENYRIPSKVREAGNNSGLEHNVLDAIVQSVGIQEVLTKAIADELAAKSAHEFGLIFSSFVGSQIGLNMLAGLNSGFGEKIRGENYFEDKHINFSKDYPEPLEEMLSTLSSALDYPYSYGIAGIATNYFEWVTKESRLALERGDYRNFIAKIQKESVQVGNLTFKNLDSVAQPANGKKIDSTEWDELGGHEEVKAHFQELVKLIKGIDHCSECKDYMKLADRLPKGTLLFGPPGTGKTDMINIFAHQAGIPYEKFSIGDVASDYKDRRTMNLGAKFEMAARQVIQGITPVYLLYITEIDALGGHRGFGGSNNDADSAVSEMLSYMRGIKSTPGVIVVADSNRAEGIDPALLSPGRFEYIFIMGYPDQDDSIKIFKAVQNRINNHASREIFDFLDHRHMASLCDNTPYLDNSKYHNIIRQTVKEGMTGGDYVAIFNNTMRRFLLDHLETGKPIKNIRTEDWIRERELYMHRRGMAG